MRGIVYANDKLEDVRVLPTDEKRVTRNDKRIYAF